ncbi:MAG: sugar-binding protein, partial [Candidatus Parabeggiatoa sp. nov. 1]
IRFAYHPEADDPWALTQHIDVYRDVNDPIATVLFTDGLKRVLQTKKDATIHSGLETAAQEMMTVSGHITFDFIGRGIAQYYPITEALGSQGVFNPGVNSVQPTVTTYDVLDRNIRTTIPDNTSTEMAYGFGLDRHGQRQFLTRVTDANDISKETYKDVRGVITAVKEFNNGGEQILWTSYDYDPLKQIVRVIDDQNHVTQVDYDNLGRRTHIDNPDMGLTETLYDLASNVTHKITANLRAEGLAIVYQYDYNRLMSITYPPRIDDKDKTVFPSIDVRYTYGEPGAADNRANRIITVEDQSGLEERFYGPLGETVKTIKTVASDTEGNSPNSPEVYTTEYVFDTWNRLQSLIYPDGEVLTNQYDSGGSIRAADGQKAQHDYTYLKRLEYDKFGQRQLVELGNNVRTRYSYNPLNRRLATLQTGKEDEETGLETLFQDLTYLYDNVGNILGQANLAAVESPSKMGGETHFQYEYDDLYRLVHAEGTFDYQPSKQHRYQLDMVYDSIHNIQAKNQLHTLRQPSGKLITQKKTTYDWQYAYGGSQPHAPTHLW